METSLDSHDPQTPMHTPPFDYHQSQFDESRSDLAELEHATTINYSGLLSMIQELQVRLQELSSDQKNREMARRFHFKILCS